MRYWSNVGRSVHTEPNHSQPPSGLCGSGVISTVAYLLRAGIIAKSGSFNADSGSPCLCKTEKNTIEFEIVNGQTSRSEASIILTQSDVSAVQLANGALRTGIELLCRENQMKRPVKILLAGAFGSYINKANAIRIGMFPGLLEEDIEVVGNAAGAEAILALFDDSYFKKARDFAQRIKVLDLARLADFQNIFIEHLGF